MDAHSSTAKIVLEHSSIVLTEPEDWDKYVSLGITIGKVVVLGTSESSTASNHVREMTSFIDRALRDFAYFPEDEDSDEEADDKDDKELAEDVDKYEVYHIKLCGASTQRWIETNYEKMRKYLAQKIENPWEVKRFKHGGGSVKRQYESMVLAVIRNCSDDTLKTLIQEKSTICLIVFDQMEALTLAPEDFVLKMKPIMDKIEGARGPVFLIGTNDDKLNHPQYEQISKGKWRIIPGTLKSPSWETQQDTINQIFKDKLITENVSECLLRNDNLCYFGVNCVDKRRAKSFRNDLSVYMRCAMRRFARSSDL